MFNNLFIVCLSDVAKGIVVEKKSFKTHRNDLEII